MLKPRPHQHALLDPARNATQQSGLERFRFRKTLIFVRKPRGLESTLEKVRFWIFKVHISTIKTREKDFAKDPVEVSQPH